MRLKYIFITIILIVLIFSLTYMSERRSTIAFSDAPKPDTAPDEIALGIGERYVLPEGYEFSSSDEEVATVSPAGVIWASGVGECEITITTSEGEKTCAVTVLEAPEYVLLNAGTTTVGTGESFMAVASAYRYDSLPTATAFTFESTSRSVASVDGYGKVTAKKKGRATIRVYSYNGMCAELEVTVKSPSKSARFAERSVTLGAGESFTPTVILSNGRYSTWTLSSSDESVVEVRGDKLFALERGKATVTVITAAGKTGKCVITVKEAPTKLIFSERNVRLGAGDDYSCVFRFSEDAYSRLTWSSSDERVATVSGGNITAVGRGTCVIFARAFNGVTSTMKVTVEDAPSEVTLSEKSIKLGVGEMRALIAVSDTPGDITYRSGNPRIATIDQNGMITGKKKGTVKVYATSYNGITAKATVTVTSKPAYLYFGFRSMDVYIGSPTKIPVHIQYHANTYPEFSIDDETIATVDGYGVVTALRPGRVILSCRTYNGLTASCELNCCYDAAEIECDDTLTLYAGESTDFPYSVTDENGELFAGTVTIESENEKYLGIEGEGLIALRHGVTKLTIKAGSAEKSIPVLINRYPSETAVAAHRGDNASLTENTMEAFVSAVQKGADFIEIDVRRTKDGHIVVMHDDSLFRTSRTNKKVSKMTLSELRSIKYKGTIPTLDEVLELLRDSDTQLLLELKSYNIEEQCVEAVKAYGLENQTVFISFDEDQLLTIQQLLPGASTGKLVSLLAGDYAADAAEKGINYLLIRYTSANEAVFSRLRAAGVKSGVWTPNTTDLINTMVSSGVDLIITDAIDKAFSCVGR